MSRARRAGVPPRVPAAFFEQPTLRLARGLIGKWLVHDSGEGLAAGRIVETEAYLGPQDLAAHSARGRRTARTEAMFGPPGRAYMFLLYGSSWAFNVVSGPPETPHAVLVRALEPTAGLALMSRRRGVAPERRELCNGPGKLCQALGLDRTFYGADLARGRLYLAEGGRSRVATSPRIHIDYAGPWVEKPWRFFEAGNRWISVAPRG